MEPLKLYRLYVKYISKSWFQYRVDAVLRSLAVFLREATGIIVIALTLQTFDDINGWNLHELLFLFSFLFLTYGIFILFFTGLRDFDKLVHSGDFDRFLLRPRGLLMQVMASNADMFASVGHGGLGIVLFFFCAGKVGVVWTAGTIAYLAVTLVSAVLIQASIFLLMACSSFWIIKIDELVSMLYYNTRKFAGYPISLYPRLIQTLLIFVVPFAFVNYFPAQFFLRKADMSEFWGGWIYLTPAVAAALFGLALLVWRVSLKRYTSAGN